MTPDQTAVLENVANDLSGVYHPQPHELPTVAELFDDGLLIVCPPGHRYKLSAAGRKHFGLPANMTAREMQDALTKEYGA